MKSVAGHVISFGFVGLVALQSVFAVEKNLCKTGDATCFAAVKQVELSFEKKFALISKNISATSVANLTSLQKSLRQFRGLDNFLQDASAKAAEIDNNLVLVHSTGATSALSIIKSGSILSLDELIRRKIVPISKKSDSFTTQNTDGIVGEQDVVFLALYPKSSDDRYAFGNVTFEFEKQPVLNKGYFTFNSFSGGYVHNPENGELFSSGYGQLSTLQEMIESYRPLIFTGYQTFLTLLTLTEANRIWLVANDFQKIQRANDSEDHLCEMLKYLSQLGASCENSLDRLQHSNALRHQISGNLLSSSDGEFLNSFIFLPTYSSGRLPISARIKHGFWEVKVPRELGLNYLRSISIDQADSRLLEPAILELAKTNRSELVKSQNPRSGRLVFTFMVAKDLQ
jgi:hypothetical protein